MAGKGYKTTRWAGLPNYECSHCEFATLDEDEMVTHQNQHPESYTEDPTTHTAPERAPGEGTKEAK